MERYLVFRLITAVIGLVLFLVGAIWLVIAFGSAAFIPAVLIIMGVTFMQMSAVHEE